MESSFSNLEERESQQLQERQRKAKEKCLGHFESIKKHLKSLQNLRLTCSGIKVCFKQVFSYIYFDDEHAAFRQKLFTIWINCKCNLTKENLHGCETKKCFNVPRIQFETLFTSEKVDSSDHGSHELKKNFKDYTRKEPQNYRCELTYYIDGLEMQIDKRALQDSE
ncbi:hypothetical protein Tco_1268923 [Tanacetum coccineum]